MSQLSHKYKFSCDAKVIIMSFKHVLKRLLREWKVLFYIFAFLLFMQVLITLTSSPTLLEDEEIQRIKEYEMVKQRQAANALLQDERHQGLLRDDVVALNPKDPKLREEFLKHTNNEDDIIEDKDLMDHKEDTVISPPPANKVEKDFIDSKESSRSSSCDVTLKDAQSAITRAKSGQCKQEISEVACRLQDGTLFPKSIPRTCPHDDKFTFPAPMPSSFDASSRRVRICYILVVHGRAFRQFRRLLRVVYNRDHYYFIHVDERSDHLHRKILKETSRYENVKVAPWRMATIWGGSSLLQMLLRALEDVLLLWKDWDYFINLSALDFPIEDEEKLVNYLTSYKDKNFMKSHGRTDDKFIRKQGLNRVFVECDHHMWRVGDREIPQGITLNGGSDWVVLSRKFCQYIITGKDRLLTDLKHWFKYTLLPAESFFHTLAQNSDMCETFVENNLRVTNWNRARGCKCQYKHVVDWCGCSPNDFLPVDLARLETTRPVFFARKFEEVINQEVVNHLDFKLYGEYPPGTPGITSYWENCYDHLDGTDSVSDAAISHYVSFARMGLSEITRQLRYGDSAATCSLYLEEVLEVEIYKSSETFSGYVVTLGASWEDKSDEDTENVSFQIRAARRPMLKILDASSKLGRRIKSAVVGTNWDVKELILRDWGGIIGPNSEPRLVTHWKKSDDDFVVTIVVVDPFNVVADYNDFRTPSKSAAVTDTPLSLRKPLRPGRWVVRFYVQRQFAKPCAEVEFVVSPLQFLKGVEGDKRLRIDNGGVEDDGQVNGANKNLYSIRTTLNLRKDKAAQRSSMSNSLHTSGGRLESWIDAMLGSSWKVSDVCIAAESSADVEKIQPTHCRLQRRLPLCKDQHWSSLSPDPKSELGEVKPNGRIR